MIYIEFEEEMKAKIMLEIIHHLGWISDQDYYEKLAINAEELDRDLEIWAELNEKIHNLKIEEL